MRVIKGDLFKIVKEGIIIQQVNCMNVMGAGFAKAFSEKYPNIKTAYHRYCKENTMIDRINHAQLVQIAPAIYGINSYTQKNFGNSKKTGINYTDEAALIKNLIKADEYGKRHNLQVYAPAFIGCGLAGGNWTNILKGVEHTDIIFVQLP